MGLEVWSPKMVEMMRRASRHTPGEALAEFRPLDEKMGYKRPTGRARERLIGPGLVYSQFLDSGIAVYGKALEYYGFKEVKGADDLLKLGTLSKGDKPKGTYCIISGEVHPDIRSELIKAFWSPANKKGELITMLLFTATGAEGLSTKYVKYVMAIEPYWHWARMEQVFARAVRLNSHMDLPEDERFVQPYLFLSDYPLSVDRSTEEYMKKMKTL
jgi:hypothetical protein